jgi:hypothetical protein
MAKQSTATNKPAASTRQNGKASKKHPKTGLEGIKDNGTTGGYTAKKLELRATKRTPQEAARRASAGKKKED